MYGILLFIEEMYSATKDGSYEESCCPLLGIVTLILLPILGRFLDCELILFKIMKNLKITLALLMLMLMVCSFIELFNVKNTEEMIWFLLFTFNMSAIIGFLSLKSINQ